MQHPKSSQIRVNLQKSEGGRGLIDLKNLHYAQIHDMRQYFYKNESKEVHRTIIESDKSYTPLNLANRNENLINLIKTDHQKYQEWASKQLHGRYKNNIDGGHIDKTKSLKWLTLGYLFPETEGFVVAIQDQVIKTKNYEKYIMKQDNVIDKCRKCGKPQASGKP